MALVIAMAVTTGFRNQLQRSLLGAMAHINVVPKVPGEGIEDWRSLMARPARGSARDRERRRRFTARSSWPAPSIPNPAC
jgi:ABC-type lipoprotein release transport system permease subunit